MWDSADPDKECVPTVIELLDSAEVMEMNALDIKALWPDEEAFGEMQSARTRKELLASIVEARQIMASKQLSSVMNLRNKHLAHSLTQTRAEKSNPIGPAKYGDELKILELSIPIIEKLSECTNSGGISFEESRAIFRKSSEELWNNCTFSISKK